MSDYKKRGQLGYGGKKDYKERSKGPERQFAKEEIRQAFKEEIQGDDFRYNRGRRMVFTKEQKIIRELNRNVLHYQRMVTLYQNFTGHDWTLQNYKIKLTKAEKELDDARK